MPYQLTIGFRFSSIDKPITSCLFVNWQRDDIKTSCQLTTRLLTALYVNWQQKTTIIYGIQYGLQGQPIMNLTTDNEAIHKMAIKTGMRHQTAREFNQNYTTHGSDGSMYFPATMQRTDNPASWGPDTLSQEHVRLALARGCGVRRTDE